MKFMHLNKSIARFHGVLVQMLLDSVPL